MPPLTRHGPAAALSNAVLPSWFRSGWSTACAMSATRPLISCSRVPTHTSAPTTASWSTTCRRTSPSPNRNSLDSKSSLRKSPSSFTCSLVGAKDPCVVALLLALNVYRVLFPFYVLQINKLLGSEFCVSQDFTQKSGTDDVMQRHRRRWPVLMLKMHVTALLSHFHIASPFQFLYDFLGGDARKPRHV